MPISMLDRSAKGTSLVTNSHSRIAKLHMSAERRLMSSGFFCKAEIHKEKIIAVSSATTTATVPAGAVYLFFRLCVTMERKQ